MGKILIVGAQGNMGKRYRAVLDYLDVPWDGVDQETPLGRLPSLIASFDGAIVATPTDTHAKIVWALGPTRKPILCEKPISKDMAELKELRGFCEETKANLTMVYQYKALCDPLHIGSSLYNYFRHGNDGLIWDCIQIVGLARRSLSLEEDSPIWRCHINGQRLDLSLMDMAYVRYVRQWLKTPGQDWGEIQEVHEKTAELDRKCKTFVK